MFLPDIDPVFEPANPFPAGEIKHGIVKFVVRKDKLQVILFGNGQELLERADALYALEFGVFEPFDGRNRQLDHAPGRVVIAVDGEG